MSPQARPPHSPALITQMRRCLYQYSRSPMVINNTRIITSLTQALLQDRDSCVKTLLKAEEKAAGKHIIVLAPRNGNRRIRAPRTRTMRWDSTGTKVRFYIYNYIVHLSFPSHTVAVVNLSHSRQIRPVTCIRLFSPRT